MILFLDIEETIVKSIDDLIEIPENIKKIQKFLFIHNPKRIETFSFGILSPHDLMNWEDLRGWLSLTHKIEVHTQTFEVKKLKQDFLRSVTGWNRITSDDLINLLGFVNKERVFEWFIRQKFTEGEFVLIDDTVPNKAIILGDLIIRFININNFVDKT